MTFRTVPALLAALALLATAPPGRADEPVVTVLTDFEDDSTAARISHVQNVLAADCAARMTPLPARGQRSLGLEIGATTRNASIACDLRFRVATRFEQADRVASYCWLREGEIELAFRVRDALGQVFETPVQIVRARYRWVRIAADLNPAKLKPVAGARASTAGDAEAAVPRTPRVVWPIEVQGYRVSTQRIGRQTVYLDELQVEHRVPTIDIIRGEFRFNEPTKIYRPGSSVGAAVVLENRSRTRAVRVSVRLGWLRPDGSVLKTQRASVNLPASGDDYRSHQAIDFSQHIDQPGLYQLVAHARAPGWTSDNLFTTTIAVTPTNRNLPRGRSAFFGVRTDLISEPLADRMLEIDLAREIGVHLLAIELPWRLIEPKAGDYQFDQFDPLIDAIRGKDMAPMITVSQPPEWLTAAPGSRATSLGALLRTCVRHYGPKVSFYQCTLEALGVASPAEQHELIVDLQRQATAVHADARLLSAPYPVPPPDKQSDSAPPPSSPTGPYLTFQTRGDSATALADLQAFAERHQLTWQRWHWWLHTAHPLPNAGTDYEAIAVLRHYVAAASLGVAGVIWSDLRDDTADPRDPAGMRGLARRAFSPKMSLLGYTTAVGTLTGLRYAGPVHGAPDAFDSALFIGSDRQVSVLLPKPNRLHPALLAPIRGVPGELKAYDFERRPLPLLESSAPPLIKSLDRPFFVSLDLETAQPEPQLALAQPWLSVPAPIFCGRDTTFTLAIRAPFALGQRSFLQLLLPSDSPFESSFSARALSAQPGDDLSYEVALTPKPGRFFDTAPLTVSLSLEGRQLAPTLEVRPLADVSPLKPDSQLIDPTYRIGHLTTADPDAATAAGTVYAAYERRRLHVAIALSDDRFFPPDTSGSPQPATGDELLFGLALENAVHHVELRIPPAPDAPRLQPLHGTPAAALRGWRCQLDPEPPQGSRIWRLDIPARSLGLSRLAPGTRFLLAARYADRDGHRPQPTLLHWGSGLDGSRSTSGFHWARLATDVSQ
jgi:hypothetical protein